MPNYNYGTPKGWTTKFVAEIIKNDTSKSEKCTDILTGVWNQDTELCVISMQEDQQEEAKYDEGSVGTCRMACAKYIAEYVDKNGKSCFTATAKEQTWNLSDDCIGSYDDSTKTKGAHIDNFVYMCTSPGAMCNNSTCGGENGATAAQLECLSSGADPTSCNCPPTCIWNNSACISELADHETCTQICIHNLPKSTMSTANYNYLSSTICPQACKEVGPYSQHEPDRDAAHVQHGKRRRRARAKK
jgi:hypothetical protein